jgi:V-type H+-transporting ATPase subunit D
MSEQVPPTRMALQVYKAKRVGAKKGYELLKKKSDALKVHPLSFPFQSGRASRLFATPFCQHSTQLST